MYEFSALVHEVCDVKSLRQRHLLGYMYWNLASKQKLNYNSPIDLQSTRHFSLLFIRHYWIWTWVKKLSTTDIGASYQKALKKCPGRSSPVAALLPRASRSSLRWEIWRPSLKDSPCLMLLSGAFSGRWEGLRVYFETFGIKRLAYLFALDIKPFEPGRQRNELYTACHWVFTQCLVVFWLREGFISGLEWKG